MHNEILDFLRKARRDSGLHSLEGKRVVELGSYDLNGTPRSIFSGAASYIGVDWRPGSGVDVVALAHEAEVAPCDVVICCQMLEHDPHWKLTVKKAVDLLLPNGGLLFATWAGPGYQPHELETAPPVPGGHPYYGNLSVEQVAEVIRDSAINAHVVTEYQRGTLDALLWARIPKES